MIGKLKILLVEDNDRVRQALREMLRTERHVVVECSEPDEALSAVTRDKSFNLLITEIDLPQMDGVALSKNIVEMISIPTIYITGNDFNESRVAELTRIDAPILFKPISAERLRREVEHVMHAVNVYVTA